MFELPHVPITADEARVPEDLWNNCTSSWHHDWSREDVSPRFAQSAYPAVLTRLPPHDMPAHPTRLLLSISGQPPRDTPSSDDLPAVPPRSLLMICLPFRHASPIQW